MDFYSHLFTEQHDGYEACFKDGSDTASDWLQEAEREADLRQGAHSALQWCIIFRVWEHLEPCVQIFNCNSWCGEERHHLTLICALTIAATMMWGYKVQDTFQAKMIWPRSKLWGRTICSRSRVDVELFLRGSPDLRGGTFLSTHTNGGLGRFLRVPSESVSMVCGSDLSH